MIDGAAWFLIPLQIFFVDLLLGADNAVVIALACQALPREQTRKAVFFGTAGAIAMRLVLTTFANAILGVPLVKLIGAWTLLVIALNIRIQHDEAAVAIGRRASAKGDFLSAALVITIADAAMSLDNVVALAAIARGNFWLLAIGVAASIPILAYGSLILSDILRRAPFLATVGAALLGWIAGDMAASDPLVADWIAVNAPALGALAPLLGAGFVLATLGLGPAVAAPQKPLAVRPRPQPPAVAAPQPAPPGLASDDRPPVPSADPRPKARPAPSDAAPQFGEAPAGGWSARPPEERIAVLGLVALAIAAGLIILVASYFDSLT